MKFVETPRLFLRNLERRDVACLLDMRTNPDCARYQLWDDTTQKAIAAYVDRFANDVLLSEKEEQHFAIAARDGQMIASWRTFSNQTTALGWA